MSDYLSRLVARSFCPNGTVKPAVRSIFEQHLGLYKPTSGIIFDETTSDASYPYETSSNLAMKLQQQRVDIPRIPYQNKMPKLETFQPVDIQPEKHPNHPVFISEKSNLNQPPDEIPSSQIDKNVNSPFSKEVDTLPFNPSNPRSNQKIDKAMNTPSPPRIDNNARPTSSKEIGTLPFNPRNRKIDKAMNTPSSSQIDKNANPPSSKKIGTLPSNPRSNRKTDKKMNTPSPPKIDKTANPPFSKEIGTLPTNLGSNQKTDKTMNMPSPSQIDKTANPPFSKEIGTLPSNSGSNQKTDKTVNMPSPSQIDKNANPPSSKEVGTPPLNLRESQHGENYDKILNSADFKNTIYPGISSLLAEEIRTLVEPFNQNIIIKKSELQKKPNQIDVSYSESSSAAQIIRPSISKKSVIEPRTMSLIGPAMIHSAESEKSSGPFIEVTIGRIEVRATPQPPPSQKQRTSPPLMSLHEYLERRARGGY